MKQTPDNQEQTHNGSPSTDNTDVNVKPLIPRAMLRPERRITALWLVPVAAALLVGWIGFNTWSKRGLEITIQLGQGHGLKRDADVKYRGIVVGQVRSIELAGDLNGILVTAVLHPQSSTLARTGTQFWVVRPQVGFAGIEGLETVVGPRYLTLLPGDGGPQRHFVGLDDPPILEEMQPGGLDIVLEASRRGSIRSGAPVLYRQVRVGTILSVGLTSDGSGVEARAHIDRAYVQLIRPETRFWNAGGMAAQVGIRGFSFQIESFESLVSGGVAMATPPNAGPVVRTGHRFALAVNSEDEWMEWEPLVVIGSSFLPPGSPMPTPLRASIGYREGRWLRSAKSCDGWVLQTDRGLLGPADLFMPEGEVDRESIVLEVAGTTVALGAEPVWSANGLVLLDARVSRLVWPTSRNRIATDPEDCLAVADRSAPPLPLVVNRLTSGEGAWLIDPALSIDTRWHGASVLSRSDGRLVGILLVTDDAPARVALLAGQRDDE